MSKLFPIPFQQFVRSAIRGESIAIRKPAMFTMRSEVFAQPLVDHAIDFSPLIVKSFQSPVGIHKSPPTPTRTFQVEVTQDTLQTASFTSSSGASSITPTIKSGVLTALSEVEQI